MNNDSNARIDTASGPHDGFEAAANYTGKFGDVGFGIGAGMTNYQGAEGKNDDGRERLASSPPASPSAAASASRSRTSG